MLARHLQGHMDALLRHFPCLALNGVRQCGKSVRCIYAHLISLDNFARLLDRKVARKPS